MKILGIGNAIVDVICKVEDDYLSNNGLTKSTMKLVDEIEFKKLLLSLKIEDTVSGGSVANSIVGLSQLGNKVGFIGKISDDDLGQKYEEGLRKENVDYIYSRKTISLFLIEFTSTSSLLIFPAVPKNVHIVLSESGVINIKQVPVGKFSFFLE